MSSISIITYVVLTLTVGYAFIYSPMGEFSALMDKKEKYENSLEMVKNIESKKNELLAKFEAIPEADRKSIETALPSSVDFVKLVSQIDAIASKYGISIDNVDSKEIVSSSGNSMETAEPAKPYNSATVSFAFTASYEKFKLFLNDLEKSLRILDIKSLSLESQEKGSGLYSYKVEFEIYWYK